LVLRRSAPPVVFKMVCQEGWQVTGESCGTFPKHWAAIRLGFGPGSGSLGHPRDART
jgi:hypothetical protein